MGLWGVLWEILKAVGPHAAPHVARAVNERRAAHKAEQRVQAVAHNMAEGLATLEERVAAAETQSVAAEERAVAAEEKLSLAQSQMAEQWTATRKWMLALLVWNAVLTAILIYVLVARR